VFLNTHSRSDKFLPSEVGQCSRRSRTANEGASGRLVMRYGQRTIMRVSVSKPIKAAPEFFAASKSKQFSDADSGVEQRDHLLGCYADLLAESHKLFGGLLQEEYFSSLNPVRVRALPAQG
jgi:hypothetical protein